MIKPLILAVDDDPQVLRAIGRDLVSKYGRDFRVVRAQSGAEGLDVLPPAISAANEDVAAEAKPARARRTRRPRAADEDIAPAA